MDHGGLARGARRGCHLAGALKRQSSAKAYQKALFEQGVPLTAFEVSDIAGEFHRLKGRGVAFTQEPTPAGPVTLAVFSDTCGNLIQIYQQ